MAERQTIQLTIPFVLCNSYDGVMKHLQYR